MQAPLVRIVDDSEPVRSALEFMLAAEGWETAAYPDAKTFLAGDLPSRPGCLVLDIRMPGISGVELQSLMAERRMRLPIIFLTGHGTIELAVEAIREGAVGFLQKPVDPARLMPLVAKAIAEDARRRGFARDEERQQRLASLTAREREIMLMVAQGLVSREISERLALSRRTVEHHRASAEKKLHADSAAEIAAYFA